MEVITTVTKQEKEVITPSVTVSNKRQPTCKELVKSEYRKECERLTWLFAVMYNEATQEQKEKLFDYHGYDIIPETEEGCSQTAMDLLYNYGLSISYVLPEDNRSRGYLQWLISWGGPSDEWRFYFVPNEGTPYKIEYHYFDWYDGAKVVCTKGRVANLLWDWLHSAGTPDYKYQKAKEESEEY